MGGLRLLWSVRGAAAGLGFTALAAFLVGQCGLGVTHTPHDAERCLADVRWGSYACAQYPRHLTVHLANQAVALPVVWSGLCLHGMWAQWTAAA